MSILGLVLGNLAVLLGAHALLRRARTGAASTDAVLFLLFRLVLISGAVLAAGALGALSAGKLALASLAALGVLLALGEHRHLPRLALPPVGRAALVFGALLLVRSLLQVWWFAPLQRDALTYHLPKIGEWIQHQGFTREWGLDLRSTFPSGFELVETWWVVFLHHDVLIEMAGLEFLALGALAVASLAKTLGASDPLACLAAYLYALTPGLCLQATSCLNDGPIAAVWTATAALVLARAPLALVAVPVCLGVGIKPTYVYALPGLLLLFVQAGRRAPGTPRAALGMAALAFAVGASWYVRNAVVYGNPIYPMGLTGIIAHQSHVAQQFGPSLGSLRDNLWRVATSRIYDHLGPYDPELKYISGWGLAPFAGGLLGLFLLVRTDALLRRVAAAYAVSLASVLLLVVPDPWCLRYVLFFPALFALAIARLAQSRRSVVMAAAATLVFEFAATMLPGSMPIGGFSDLVSHPWRERCHYTIPALDGIEAVGFLERPDAEVKIYPAYRPDFSRRVVPLRAETAEGVRDLLRQEGLEYFYCPSQHPLAAAGAGRGYWKQTLNAGLYRLQ